MSDTITYMDLNARMLKNDGTLSDKTVDISTDVQLDIRNDGAVHVQDVSLNNSKVFVKNNNISFGNEISLTKTGSLKCKNFNNIAQEKCLILDRLNTSSTFYDLMCFEIKERSIVDRIKSKNNATITISWDNKIYLQYTEGSIKYVVYVLGHNRLDAVEGEGSNEIMVSNKIETEEPFMLIVIKKDN